MVSAATITPPHLQPAPLHTGCAVRRGRAPSLTHSACAPFAQEYSSKRSLFPHPLEPGDPRGHCGPNDVLLNPSATFTFEQMVDVSHFVMCAINAMTYPPQVHFTSEQAQVAALHWFEVVSGHLHSAMAQKMDYTSPEGTQWYYDLEQAENRAEILLSTIHRRLCVRRRQSGWAKGQHVGRLVCLLARVQVPAQGDEAGDFPIHVPAPPLCMWAHGCMLFAAG